MPESTAPVQTSRHETVDGRDRYRALTLDADGEPTLLAATATDDDGPPGFAGYLVPWYSLSDRGTFFRPGAAKKTAREQIKLAPHLYQHDAWEPIGKHIEATEDDHGFRIRVAVNDGSTRGAEVLSHLRFGTPLGLSVGFTIPANGTRPGTPKDDAKLDRRFAGAEWAETPIEQLTAITEFAWLESSTVTFPALGNARHDHLYAIRALSADPDAFASVERAIGTLTALARLDALSDAHHAAIHALMTSDVRAAAGTDHSTRTRGRNRSLELAMLANRARG